MGSDNFVHPPGHPCNLIVVILVVLVLFAASADDAPVVQYLLLKSMANDILSFFPSNKYEVFFFQVSFPSFILAQNTHSQITTQQKKPTLKYTITIKKEITFFPRPRSCVYPSLTTDSIRLLC